MYTRPARAGSGSTRRLALLLLAVVVPPALTLAWLGARLLEQDRSLLEQQERDRRAAMLSTAVRALDAAVSDLEHRLPGGPLPEGVVRLRLGAAGVEAEPPDGVAWVPAPPSLKAAEAASLPDAEALEFRGDPRQALAAYVQASTSRDAAVRAAALVGAARVLRKQRMWDGALQTYQSLAGVRNISLANGPADLQARRAACDVLEQAGRRPALESYARDLQADLLAGRWPLDRAAWELTVADLERWTGRAPTVAPDRVRFSEVAAVLWNERSGSGAPRPQPSGRRLVAAAGTATTVVWRTDGPLTTALAVAPAVLQAWADRAIGGRTGGADRLSLADESGQVLAGAAPASEGMAIRAKASDTGLPWAVVLSPGDVSPIPVQRAARRRLLAAGLAAILGFLAGAAYFLWRVVRREIAVVRQQTEFVAAVSHEFRTPLTSLRHVTELLQEDDDLPADRRRSFYDALGRSTERLHRLVESLLDFSRMESGKKPYDLQPLDAGELVERVVADFAKEAAPSDAAITCAVDSRRLVNVRADAPALTHALWNLLDNAVKYSPTKGRVRVSVEREAANVAITVRDEGVGIPAHEQSEIFDRFVRGDQASRLGIKGTGLGLAIVSHVVSAHGGAIELASEEGAGSTFRVLLPALD